MSIGARNSTRCACSTPTGTCSESGHSSMGCRAIGAGRLVAVVHGWRGRGNRRGDRDAARTSGREPHGAGLGGPLHQSEAARPLPGSLLAGGREGRPARCTGSGLGVADRPSLPAAPGVDRPDDHRIARVVAPQRGHVRLVVERLVLVNQQKHPRRPSQPTRRSCCRCLASARAFSPPCSPRPATCCSDETMPRCAVSAGVAPVTRRSGRSLVVTRRLAAHDRLRDAAFHWARVAANVIR